MWASYATTAEQINIRFGVGDPRNILFDGVPMARGSRLYAAFAKLLWPRVIAGVQFNNNNNNRLMAFVPGQPG